MRYLEIPRPIRFTATAVALNLLIFTVLRLAFLAAFNSPQDPLGPLLWKSLYIGLKFDMRLAIILNLPLMFTWIHILNPYDRRAGKILWGAYLIIANLIVLLVYILDFGHYAYLSMRLDATALRFLQNPLISFGMVWETYPVVPIVLGLAAFLADWEKTGQSILGR